MNEAGIHTACRGSSIIQRWQTIPAVQKALGILFMLLIPGVSRSQYFTTGEDPSSLRWRQINTPAFRLIYPGEFEENAQRMANYFETVYKSGGITLDHAPRKISILFHTRNVRSNGLVGMAPRRMELFTPPHQEMYAQDWLEQLALHEFRHVVQTDKIYSQVPGWVKGLLGEQGAALITGLYLPFWFLEGDAVVTETALSRSGRGRQASFLMEHKAQVTQKGVFSFSKAYHGSFRDFVPDHYALGYHLVGESRARYGPSLWINAIDQLSRHPFSLVPLSKTLRKHTGMDPKGLYQMVFDSLRQSWLEETNAVTGSACQVLTAQPASFTNYLHNHLLPSGDIITYQTGFSHIPRFIRISEARGEETITIPGQIFGESIGYRNNLIAWSEFVPDLRWSHSGKSFIRIFDIQNCHLRTIIPEYKSLAPAISPDEHNVAVVEADFGNRYYLSVYQINGGGLLKRFRLPENEYLFNPCWKTDSTLYVVVLTSSGKRIACIHPWHEQIEYLHNQDLGEIRHLTLNDSLLFFISSFTGKDELYSIDPGTGKINRMLSARFGLGFPAFQAEAGKLIISDYTSDGYRLICTSLQDLSPVPLSELRKGTYPLADILANQESGIVDFSICDTFRYDSRPFRKGSHLFNLHSWAPISLDINTFDVAPGISFLSQNVLGTNVTTAGYKWNQSEKAGQYYINVEYKGWYPVLKFEAQTGRHTSEYPLITEYLNPSGQVVNRDTSYRTYSWGQHEVSADVSLPLQLTRGKYYRLLQPGLKYEYAQYSQSGSAPATFPEGTIQTLAWRLYYHQLMRQAYRDLQSPWGVALEVTYRHSPMGDHNPGVLSGIQLINYWPGWIDHHGFTTYCGFQRRKEAEYRFNDAVRWPRGWQTMNSRLLFSSSLTYSLPLLYPDLSLGRWAYVRRIKSSLFVDYGWLKGDLIEGFSRTGNYTKNMTSLGIDLTADTHFLRFYAPANVGIRTIYLPATGRFKLDFLFSVNFASF